MSLKKIRHARFLPLRTAKQWAKLRDYYENAVLTALAQERHNLDSLFIHVRLIRGKHTTSRLTVDDLDSVLWMLGYGKNNHGTIIRRDGTEQCQTNLPKSPKSKQTHSSESASEPRLFDVATLT